MKVVIEREKCIGCGTCAAVCSAHFRMGEDGKSELIGSKNRGEKEVDSANCSQEAVESCPVQCIRIEK